MERSLKSSKHWLREIADLKSVRKVFGIWMLAACLVVLSVAMSGSAWSAPKLELISQVSLANNLAGSVQGNYAYTGDGGTLKVLDISNPAKPTVVGTSAPMNNDGLFEIVVKGNYAYLANSRGGLRIMDVSNPQNPTQVGIYNSNQSDNPNGWALWGVDVRDNYAYVADMGSGLRIVDVSNPAKPVEVSFIGSHSLTHEIKLNGNFAYMVDWSGGLRIVDITDPKSPKEVGFSATKGITYGVAFSDNGKLAYVADYNGLRIVDISNPKSPKDISFYGTPGIATIVVASGNYVYVNSGNELKVLDVSNPQSPQQVDSYNAPENGSGYGLSRFNLNNGLLYVPNRDGGLLILSNGLSNTTCTEWNLAKDFRMSPNQENPNRDSCGNKDVWHFMQSGDMIRNPQTYTLMPNFSTNSRYDGTPGIHNWTGTEMPDVTVYKTEKDLIYSNTSILTKYIYMHPGWSHLTVIGWRSPINGNMKVSGEIASQYNKDCGDCVGDGIKWYIDKGATHLVSGAFPSRGSQNLQEGTIGNTLANIPVTQGEFIYFVIDRNANAFGDGTKFDVTISQVGATNPATCPTTPTIRSKASGNWTDAATWDSGRIPNATDVVQIESGHTVTAEFSKVTGLCNFGTINSQNSDLRIDASDFLYNKGTIRASDAKNSECPVKNNPSVYKHPSQLSSGNSIFLWAAKFTNEGQITGGKGGDDSTWLCLSDYDPGKWSYPVISTDGTIRLHKSEKGTWGFQQGETQYGFPSVGGEGGKVEIRSTGFENAGTIKGGKGGYGDSSSNGYGVHGVSIGGKGGEVIVTPADLEKSSNKGTLQGGCGGDVDIPGCWATSDIYCNDTTDSKAITNPSRPGNGGDVTFNAVDMSGVIKGCTGSRSSWDPTTLKATATTRFEGSDYVEIYGREGWVMDLTGLIEGAVTANKTITIAVGKGGTIDLRGVKGKVFQAAEKVEFFADTILLDSGVTVQDLAQAANVTVAPGKILYRAALSSVQQVVGKAGETVPIQLSVFNNGSTADTYTFTVESSTGWKVSGLPGTVTIEGLKSVQIPLNILLSSVQGDNGVITITAASQNDPQVRAITVIRTATEEGADSDGDGIPDNKDIFPNDSKEQLDSDKDGIGDNTDTDDDNDGMPDEWEKRYNLNPLVNDASTDSDKDGYSNFDEYKVGTDPNDPASKPADPTFKTGIFTVDDTGIVKIDWLYDGGKYQGEFGIFNLAGMDTLTPGSPEFIAEAAKRVLSDSEQGYLAFSDLSEGARFSGLLGGEVRDWNAGPYKGVKSFDMTPGTQFATILVPNSTFASLAQNPLTEDPNKRPLFSLVSSNPAYGMSVGQIADINGTGKAFAYEDKNAATSDWDFNDLIIQITGAESNVQTMDQLESQRLAKSVRQKRDRSDWRDSELGRAILEHVEAPAAAEDSLSMTVTLNIPTTLLVYDSTGKVIGKAGGTIAGANFELKADGTQTVTLPNPAGNYRVAIQGAATAQSTLTVKTYQGGAEISSAGIPVDIAPHQILTTTISADGHPPVVAPINAATSYDFNGDGVTDNADVSMLVRHWNSCKGQQKYDAFFDVNDDGCITVADIMMVLNAKTVK